MKKYKITITQCISGQPKKSSFISLIDDIYIGRQELRNMALRIAITRQYGSRAWLLKNYDMENHGQVFYAVKPSRNNSNPGSYGGVYIHFHIEEKGEI